MGAYFFVPKRRFLKLERRKIKLQFGKKTFGECVEMFKEDCEARGLRKDTIRHYDSAIKVIYKKISPSMPVDMINKTVYDDYARYQNSRTDITSQSKRTNIQDLSIILRFMMKKEYIEPFETPLPKVDKKPKETYTENEIKILLKEPTNNSFAEYRNCCIVNLLFSTGLRLGSLVNIKVSDIDFDTQTLNLRHTKNHEALIIPLSKSILAILKKYIRISSRDKDDWLFCNVYGDKLIKSTISHDLVEYNRRRGVDKTGIHRWRHTFAKYWVLNGGSVVVLSRLLGHSDLKITQRYINLLVTDMKKEVDEIDILNKFCKKSLKLSK